VAQTHLRLGDEVTRGLPHQVRSDQNVTMVRRRIYDSELYAHFVTFSCFKRRRRLDHDRARKIVLGVLHAELSKQHARCVGFVLMPDHVHAIVWFPQPSQLGLFMKQWKQRSSFSLKRFQRSELAGYGAAIGKEDPFWQRKYYAFHIHSREKLEEKLHYMHMNPVRSGLVERAVEWSWSSARWYEQGRDVGVPIHWVD
jgi:putative transposase